MAARPQWPITGQDGSARNTRMTPADDPYARPARGKVRKKRWAEL
ncbi:hypothetical protein OOU_Y34scaffold00548g31 [Pyricularia oryzae Y34]|uniref:Uncharacterized protein n=3 Tax=Pyricularia oryzae TaxID=318829 RepID=A0A4P7N8K5_PYROR|nr:hypothetical protein OOU_Y34scaffold00548g31 [Pyricularia oryzae Y34]QBZ59047.1 hypothetical protein PoMZ_04007 [Pyricularia oryzae]